jgi:hypothetical protein
MFLSYSLNKLKYDIEGLSLPGYFVWLIFANDITIYFKSIENNMDKYKVYWIFVLDLKWWSISSGSFAWLWKEHQWIIFQMHVWMKKIKLLNVSMYMKG